jgi:hypothetical protein
LFDDVPYEKMESLEWPVLKASVGKTKRMSSGYQLFYRITSTPQNPVSSSVSISQLQFPACMPKPQTHSKYSVQELPPRSPCHCPLAMPLSLPST